MPSLLERPRKTRLFALALFAVIAVGITAACGGNATNKPPGENGPSVTPVPLTDADAQGARDEVIAYLSDKAWGFFGATCDQWVAMDYEFSPGLSGNSTDDATVVVFSRRPDREVGPLTLTFRIGPSGTVSGENKLERSGIAEGCDKW